MIKKTLLVVLLISSLSNLNLSSNAQNSIPNQNQTPLNVKPPIDRQDFENQCQANLQTQGIPASQSQEYCKCSADVAYKNFNENNSNQQAIIDEISKCTKFLNLSS